MAKELLNFGGGLLVLSEEAGDFKISISKDASVGGGQAAGVVVAEGQASIVIKGKLAFDLGMKLLEAHSPSALVALEEGVKAIADAAIDKL